MDFQRLNADAYTLNLDKIQPPDWVAQVTHGFQARLQTRQIRLQVNLADNLPALVSDITTLNRVLTELLSNACKYSPSGEQILVEVAPLNEQQIQLSVCNTGVEIAAEELARIFDPFYRVPQGDRWQQGGTGLGLSLVKKMVAVLGGSIQVKSGSGETCFTLRLPIQPPEPGQRLSELG
ncbi:HAMP domain-containing histidine kinase [Leptolyngbya sp. FACHB-36]|uniref:sensor histidine kinase n=1 Tax=Leptolyngbya sp. FACHB-36 TaxID=2692808 RepID=UPI0016801C75|nr:HAMP domain-containing sensor histidine kinase [Leptolyngbya sp. FACHB-36]MBD2020603.1 HAMP domain-containing histidine kinase [Leptolyngbya sp. FACHB-36]